MPFNEFLQLAPALAICAAGGDWGRCDGQRCRRRGCAVGTKRNWRSQGNIRLVPFRNRRPRRGSHHGGNDFSGTGASSCVRGAEPSRDVLSAGHGAHLRRSAGPDAPWPRFMAAAARCRPSRAAGSGLMPLASSTTPRRAARLPPSPSSARLPQWGHSRRSNRQQDFADVRYAFNNDRLCASRRTDAMCQEATYAAQQIVVYSITSLAIASSLSGIWRPSALAVLRLITKLNVEGSCIGRSAGLVPRRIGATY